MIPVTATSAPRAFVIAFSTAVAAVLVTGACGPVEPELQGPIDADTYVAVMAELADLERFPPPGSDEATRAERADSARRDILARHGVTADELLDFAEAAGARPGLMVELLDRIVEVSDSLARRRTGAGRAADSAARTAADSGADTGRDPGLASDSIDAPPAGTTSAARDSLLLRQRLREMRGRVGEKPRPSL